MKKRSFLLWLGVIVLLLVGAYSGYLYWQNSAKASELKAVEREFSEYNNQVLQSENKNVLEAINAKQTLNSLKEGMIEWSEVVGEVRATIPTNRGEPLVEVLSYSSANDAAFSLSVKTLASSFDPYADVADLIEIFNESDEFENAFVPSISAGEDEEGNLILTFAMTVDYVQEDVKAALEQELGEVINDSIKR